MPKASLAKILVMLSLYGEMSILFSMLLPGISYQACMYLGNLRKLNIWQCWEFRRDGRQCLGSLGHSFKSAARQVSEGRWPRL